MAQGGNAPPNLVELISTLQGMATVQATLSPQVPSPQGGTIPGRVLMSYVRTDT